jgi:uncharacterized protein with gpF-like domain
VRYDLAALTRRANPGIRRREIVVRDIVPPATLASDLYAAAYKPVVELWASRTDAIIAEYERTLSSLTTDSPADLQARLDAATSDLERLFILIDASLRDWTVRVERWQREKWRGAVLAATGVDLQTLIGPEDVRATLEQYLEWNTSLVRDVSAQARQRISNAVFTGLTQRKPVREVAAEIRGAVGMARDRSMRIAADQLSKITSSLAEERRREAGISLWKWRWSHKKHGRAEHIARDGKFYADSEAGAGATANGEEVLPPPEDRPGQLPYCGCRGQAVLVLD